MSDITAVKWMEDYSRNRFLTLVRSRSPKRVELVAHEFARTVVRISMTLNARAAAFLEWVSDPAKFPDFAVPQSEGNTIIGIACIGDAFAYGVAIKKDTDNIVLVRLSRGNSPRVHRTIQAADYAPGVFADEVIAALAHLEAKADLGEPSPLR
ncbi:hypothetical protein [Rhizobium sp. BK176]|uniref:hypothetical protein n=1 Tax=Rhizobium sp. BK176 TaxID=2587071 RepID=UPI002169E672|nr:hypothetical protein [Rhizobium sp. BK176]MCS4088928.1 hypothetical protein [Rhizobium sp. BK176]